MVVATSTKKQVKSKKPVRQRRKRLTREQRHDEILGYINLCFMMMDDLSVREIAERTGLSQGTIQYLARGEASLKMHVNTFQSLGAVAGLKMDLTSYDAKITLIDD